MTNNPLARRRVEATPSFGGPVQSEDPQGWCDWRNERMQRQDIEWIVRVDGRCELRTKPPVLTQRIADEKRRAKADSQKALHRMSNPAGRGEAA